MDPRMEEPPPFDKDLLEASLAAMAPRLLTCADRFYERLFRQHPEFRRLFSSSLELQKRHLAAALCTIVKSLREPAEMEAYVGALVGAHIAYGVERQDFGVWVENLLTVLAEVEGSAWTPSVEQAWRGAFETILEFIYHALNEVTPLPIAPKSVDIEDPLVVASEYLDLSQRWRKPGEPLRPSEIERWKELRELLDDLLEATTPPGKEKRRGLRVPVDLSAVVRECSGATAAGAITEIGEAGLFIATDRPLEAGTAIILEIERGPASSGLRLEGSVAWVRQSGAGTQAAGMGIRFDGLDPEQDARLRALVESALAVTLRQMKDRGRN